MHLNHFITDKFFVPSQLKHEIQSSKTAIMEIDTSLLSLSVEMSLNKGFPGHKGGYIRGIPELNKPSGILLHLQPKDGAIYKCSYKCRLEVVHLSPAFSVTVTAACPTSHTITKAVTMETCRKSQREKKNTGEEMYIVYNTSSWSEV